jgi:hypothetical protein
VMEVRTGNGLFTVKLTAAEEPPPGDGFVTEIGKIPPNWKSEAESDTLNWFELMKVVGRPAPPIVTTEFLTYPEPLRLTSRAPLPAMTLDGLRVWMSGAGFWTVNITGFETTAFEFTTFTSNVPEFARSKAEIEAVSLSVPTKAVCLAVPFSSTVDSLVNPVPFTTMAKPLCPTIALDGESPKIEGVGIGVGVGAGVGVGVGALTTKLMTFESPPPGPGLFTTMG